jgi:hypothetical protein
MLTMMLREKVPPLAGAEACAIACPACMTLQLAASCAPFVTTLVHGCDIVPTFSTGAIDALRQEVGICCLCFPPAAWLSKLTASLWVVKAIGGRVETPAAVASMHLSHGKSAQHCLRAVPALAYIALAFGNATKPLQSFI